MRASVRIVLLFGSTLLLLGPLAHAEDGDDLLEQERLAKEAVAHFRKTYRSRDPRVRCDALLEVSQKQHRLVVQAIGKALRKERNLLVVEAGANVLGDMSEVAAEAGAIVKAQIRQRRGTKAAELLRTAAGSIGKLRYRGAHDELLDLLDHTNQWVVVAAIKAIGDVGDKKALPKLYKMAAVAGEFYSDETRTAAGSPRPMADADRQRASRKAGAGQSRRVYAEIVKLYMRHLRETVKKLTGEEFQSLKAFKTWLEEHPEEVGRETQKTRPRR